LFSHICGPVNLNSRATKNDTELKKGSAETLILALLSEQQLHGYGIAKRIEEKSEGALQFHVTSLYPILYRLERQGLVQSNWQQPEGGRRRRYYELTPAGEAMLRERRSSWRTFIDAVESVIEPA
jgi:transcriptional regulator